MAQRDRAAVDVDSVRVDTERAGRGDADGGKGLVQLEQVDIVDGQPLPGQGLANRVGRLLLQGVVRAGDDSVRTDLGQPRQAELLRLVLAHDHHRSGPVADLRGVTGADRAVRRERRA